MNTFEISRKWFDFCFENTSKIKPIHTALFFFIIEHNNRLGWKKEFGLPRQMAMDAIGVKNNKTYSLAFNDLEDWGFVNVIERSKNQYSANIISLFGCVKNTPATTKALAKASLKHLLKHDLSIAPINKPNNQVTNNTILKKESEVSEIQVEPEDETIKQLYYKDEKEFLSDWNSARKIIKNEKSNYNKLNYFEIEEFNKLRIEFTIEDFKNGMRGLFNQKEIYKECISRPRHFLSDRNIEKYIDCHLNKSQLFQSKVGKL